MLIEMASSSSASSASACAAYASSGFILLGLAGVDSPSSEVKSACHGSEFMSIASPEVGAVRVRVRDT